MASERGAFWRAVDYIDNNDRLSTLFILACILGLLITAVGASCHVTISINDSKPAEVSHAK